MMAMEPAGWWTSEDVEVERGRISKIRARHYLRNRLLYKSISGPEGRRRTVRPGSGRQFCGRQSDPTRAGPLTLSGRLASVLVGNSAHSVRPSAHLNAVTRGSDAHRSLVRYNRLTHKLANRWSRRPWDSCSTRCGQEVVRAVLWSRAPPGGFHFSYIHDTKKNGLSMSACPQTPPRQLPGT